MSQKFMVPLWVEVVYRVLEWVDYRVLSPISSHLAWWRSGLLDHYCRCKQCLERQRTGTP